MTREHYTKTNDSTHVPYQARRMHRGRGTSLTARISAKSAQQRHSQYSAIQLSQLSLRNLRNMDVTIANFTNANLPFQASCQRLWLKGVRQLLDQYMIHIAPSFHHLLHAKAQQLLYTRHENHCETEQFTYNSLPVIADIYS